MKLRLNHIEICTKNPEKVKEILEEQFRFKVVGYRETPKCSQTVLQSGKTVFIITSRKLDAVLENVSSNGQFINGEPWTMFCCSGGQSDNSISHIDSVFNVALCVDSLAEVMERLAGVEHRMIQGPVEVDGIHYAIVASICGDIVHTIIEKKRTKVTDWFLPGFTRSTSNGVPDIVDDATTHMDHIAYACRAGESSQILNWYEKAFGMKRFLTNRNDDVDDGVVIGGDVGMRLKALEFWQCSETGLASTPYQNGDDDVFKLVLAESLPNIKNTQIEGFLKDHNGPGLQHIGLHTSNMVKTVDRMTSNGVKFRHPPKSYYTKFGQLEVIEKVGEDINLLRKCGILLDNEADTFDDTIDENHNQRYLMQIFTFPIFDEDTFFFEVIQRKGARGFGVGNVSVLARLVTSSKLQNQIQEN